MWVLRAGYSELAPIDIFSEAGTTAREAVDKHLAGFDEYYVKLMSQEPSAEEALLRQACLMNQTSDGLQLAVTGGGHFAGNHTGEAGSGHGGEGASYCVTLGVAIEWYLSAITGMDGWLDDPVNFLYFFFL